jgi:hypothetical protein
LSVVQTQQLAPAHTTTPGTALLDERPRIEATTSVDDPHSDELTLARDKLESWVQDEIDHSRSAGPV